MTNSKTRLISVALGAALVLTPAARAGWMDFANSVLTPQKNNQKHPKSVTQMVITRRDSPGAEICVAYLNSLAKKNQGRVVAKVEVVRGEEVVNSLKFAGGVQKNAHVNCKAAGDLETGDIVFFDIELKGFPRVKQDDFIEVNGVISTAGEPSIDSFGLHPVEGPGWVHTANSVFVPEEDNKKHPKSLERAVLVPLDAVGPEVCAAYTNNTDEKRAGRVITNVSITREDGVQESLKLVGGVQANSYLNCKPVGDLVAGDLVEFDFEFKGMPRLAGGGADAEIADVYGAVTTAEEVDFQNPPEVAESPGGGGGGGGDIDGTPGSGPLSEADEIAAFRLLVSTPKTQLQRPRGNSPAKWVAVGPRSIPVPDGSRVDMATAGGGSTIAAAVADYERKMRDTLGSGGALSSRDRAAIQWYSDMNASSGPTAIRRDTGGGLHGEYYRPGRGSIHKAGFGSIAAVVDWFKSQGL